MKKLNNLIIFVTVLLFYNCTSGGDPDPSAFRFDYSFRNGTNDVIIVRRYLNPIDNEISSNLILNTTLSPDQCGANGHFDKSREGKVAIISIDSIDFISYKDDKILKRYRREGIYSTPSSTPTPFDIRQYKSSCCDYSSYDITYEDFDY